MTPKQIKDLARRRSPTGHIKKIYHNQRMTTQKMKRALPTYSEAELYTWAINHGLLKLHAAWETSNYNKWDSPSVDRLDNTKSYSLDNIQLITWKENLANQKIQNKTGEYLHTASVSIDQLTPDGHFIRTWPSISNACRAVVGHGRGVSNISSVAAGKNKTAYGFRWRFTALC